MEACSAIVQTTQGSLGQSPAEIALEASVNKFSVTGLNVSYVGVAIIVLLGGGGKGQGQDFHRQEGSRKFVIKMMATAAFDVPTVVHTRSKREYCQYNG